jgi:phospholipid/cholesterol/gamma-HCH transport system ATP-binding protein
VQNLPAASAATEIKVEGLKKSFRGRVVLDGINTRVGSGELLAIVGASGSGKTVFMDHLVGLLRPDEGRVLVADHDAAPGPDGFPPLRDLGGLSDDELDRIRLRWAVVFQRNALFSGSVRDNIALWLREHTDLKEADIERRIRETLAAAALDVEDVLDKDRDSLSGGMAKRVAIARALAIDPLVVFYDEPTTGLDPIVGGHIHELIWNVHFRPVGEIFAHTDTGSSEATPVPMRRTTIIVTHDKDLLRRLRPRVVMLDDGRVCFDGPYDQFGGPDCPPAQQYLAAMPVLHARKG